MMCNGVVGWVRMVVGCVESLAGCVGGAVFFVGGIVGCVGYLGKDVELVVALSAAVQPTDHWVSEEWTWQEVRLLVVVGA
jgi:hypothetical protein